MQCALALILVLCAGGHALAQEARPALQGEASEDWVLLGTKLHGGFGSYIALGVYIGLDARTQLNAEPRTMLVSLTTGASAPCACVADGLQLSTGATSGRGLLRVDSSKDDVFGIVVVTNTETKRSIRYTIPSSTRPALDAWNKIPANERLSILRTVPENQLFLRERVD
jgi:hypothetical protein